MQTAIKIDNKEMVIIRCLFGARCLEIPSFSKVVCKEMEMGIPVFKLPGFIINWLKIQIMRKNMIYIILLFAFFN